MRPGKVAATTKEESMIRTLRSIAVLAVAVLGA